MQDTLETRREQDSADAAEFRTHYDLDHSTGILTRKVAVHRGADRLGPVGKPSGKHGHLQFRHKGRFYYVARVAFLMVHGYWPRPVVDHVSGDVTDNRPANLREANHSGNAQNRAHITPGRLSEFIGVSLTKNGKFRAYIRVDGVQKHLGCHECELAARDAYLAAKAEHHTFAPIPRDLVSVEG